MSRGEIGRGAFFKRFASWMQSGWPRVGLIDAQSHSWARRVASIDEVPTPYREFYKALPADQQEPFPYSVLTPTFRGIGRRLEREKLVCLVGESMHVVEHHDGQLASTSLPLHGRCHVERGVLLLHSWISVHGPDPGCASRSCTLQFNSVTDHLMAPFVDALRAPSSGAAVSDPEAEREHFNHLAQTHYKFYSHGRNSMRPGDRALELLLQPQVQSTPLRLLGYSISRRLSPAHLTILTETEIVLIRDDESQSWITDPAPGAIWDYIPRSMVRAVSIERMDNGLLALRIALESGPVLTCKFDDCAEPELLRLVRRFQA